MKKFLLALFIVFVANLGCKKLDKGGMPCACSPMAQPPLILVIKATNGDDLLNPATNGHFTADNIKVYHEAGGKEMQMAFRLAKPFSYGNASTEKFEYYQIQSALVSMYPETAQPSFYLKLGNGTPLLLKPTMDKDTKYKVAKLLVNDVEATPETGAAKNILPNVFYITLP